MKYYKLFYPNTTKKILPNISIKPNILLYWYIGDGSIKKQNQSLNNGIQITNKWGNKYIEKQFKTLFHINCKYYNNKNNQNFYFPPYIVNQFLSYIGKCPIKCYSYKWISRRCSTTIIEPSLKIRMMV